MRHEWPTRRPTTSNLENLQGNNIAEDEDNGGVWENPWQGVGEKTSENPIGSNCSLLQFLFQTSNWTPSNLDQNEEKQISVLIFGWIPRKVQIYDRGFVVSDGNKLPDASTTIWNSPGHGSQQKESFWKQRLFGRHKFFLVHMSRHSPWNSGMWWDIGSNLTTIAYLLVWKVQIGAFTRSEWLNNKHRDERNQSCCAKKSYPLLMVILCIVTTESISFTLYLGSMGLRACDVGC